MTYINKQWLLDQRPKGMPGDECWKLNEVEVPPLKKGEVLSMENIWVKRPGTGTILAEHFNSILGRKATRNIENDEQLNWEDFE